ncbi:uncharacterized protein A4U43_C09F4030 [Asparagus officinalis]|uniref:K Homology domain-containing protein n=1 Tax=Asparagus officinalis TaxID=4686 RepID=A0A5P1E568_ASPOF|nr:uncharacterized protein A4U43_C09F4030 [Asparagus officinalis]
MDERMPPAAFFQYSPSGLHSSPHHSIRPSSDRESFNCGRSDCAHKDKAFLDGNKRHKNEDILDRMTDLYPHGVYLFGFFGYLLSIHYAAVLGDENGYLPRMGMSPAPSVGWNGTPGVSMSPVIKKVVRLDVPVDKFPNYNFVGRLLGPRGNSLKRVEATTRCRVYIRGRGSVKDSVKEEMLRDKPGYEHLNEPLHVLVEGEFSADIIDLQLNQAVTIVEELLQPVDESTDFYKKQQLRELAILNGTLREESPHMSPSASPFNSTGMKRAKTGL